MTDLLVAKTVRKGRWRQAESPVNGPETRTCWTGQGRDSLDVAAEDAKQEFFNAVELVVGLLRFRIVDSGFRAPGTAGGRAARQRAEGRTERRREGRRTLIRGDLDEALQVLADARDGARRSGCFRIDGLIEEIGAYLEMRPIYTLLFRHLLHESEDDS